MAEQAILNNTRGLKGSDLAVPAALMVVILFMLFPLGSSALDVMLSMNLAFSVLVLLVTLYTTEPLQFSSFPSLLLIATLVRLSFNVAATRLILSGDGKPDTAGRLIEAFGNMVGGGNAVVGFVVFVILVIIQFVVITSGAQRVSEVAARFTLDAMPGKQMAIDADLNSGLITEDDARKRREKIGREANFYGAMDGASKFVRGDAIAAVIILVVNILGGFVVGFLNHGFSDASQVMRTYTLLTIGDGLVTQIPALLISVATGLLVTRSATESNLGHDVTSQLFTKGLPIAIGGIVLGAMAIAFHNWASVPLMALAIAAYFAYAALNRKADAVEAVRAADEALKPKTREPENVAKLLAVDPMELEIGFGLVPLVDEAQGGDLLDRITMIRRQVALDLGLVVPPIRIRDNMSLGAEAYAIKIRGTEVARGTLMANRFLAINSSGTRTEVPGVATKEPTFGLPAVWVEEAMKPLAESSGYTVVDLPSVMATHLTEVIRAHASELLTRQDTQKLVDNFRQGNAAVVDELVPGLMNLGDVQKVLQNLLRERIPIRDMGAIMETLADNARGTKDSDTLTEHARQALYRVITKQYAAGDGAIHAVTLDPRLEQTLMQSVTRGEGASFLALDPRVAQKILLALSRQIEVLNKQGHPPLVLCSPLVRPYFKRLLDKVLPNLTVLSYNELDPKVEIQSAGSVRTGDED